MTTAVPRPPRWHAGIDGVGHAYPRGELRATRSFCDRRYQAERFDWPIQERCATCVAAADELIPPKRRRGGARVRTP